MKRRLSKVYPLLVALAVCTFLNWVQERDAGAAKSPSPFQRIERLTEDWRTRVAQAWPAPNAVSNLVAVGINEHDLDWMNRGFSAARPRWPFSHFYYGLFIAELKAQGVATVGFDMVFSGMDETRPFIFPGSTNKVIGTAFFAEQMRSHGGVILGSAVGSFQQPIPELATNAYALGHAIGHPDEDNVFRRIPVFSGTMNGGRIWCLGFVMAARQLGLDLQNAEVSPGRLVLRGEGGVVREVPLTPNYEIYLDWSAHPAHPQSDQRVRIVPFRDVLRSALQRTTGRQTNDLDMRNKLMVVGAANSGMSIHDRGATALGLGQDMFLAHLNVANSLLTGRFIRAVSPETGLKIALALTALATALGWRLRTLWASVAVVACAAAYVAIAVWMFVAHRILLPVALPVFGALLTTHLVMTVCRTAENTERRHVERMLQRVVSPKVIDTLLAQESPMPETHRTEITVFFADLRGFTHFAEEAQGRAEAAARALELPPEAARAFADEAARTAMSSVNRYLTAVVDEIKATDGTLDKYMGDCVMAFWGAPVADPNHGAQALKCAVAVQQSIERINREHAAENELRERENRQGEARRQAPRSLLPVLRLGVGLNSGLATVGFMGSENHLSSYTAFGHVVNVASRVEGLARGGQIVLTAHTLNAAARYDSTVATRCISLSEVYLKGMTAPVKMFELRWKEGSEAPDVLRTTEAG
ncbi:MAG: adenylate/guanylate cyclase domain-containing protein [Limisphaerales bacterium]